MKSKVKLRIDVPKGQALLDLYREQLRRVHGDEIADRSWLDYDRGWYYINVARRFPDGSVWVLGEAQAYRRIQVYDMFIELKKSET